MVDRETLQKTLTYNFKSNLVLDNRIEADKNYDAFLTKDSRVAVFDVINEAFTPQTLAEYVDVCEKLCQKYDTQTNMFLIAMENTVILVNEFDIASPYDFCIKLAKAEGNIVEIIFKMIMTKIINGEKLDDDDIKALKATPSLCNTDEQRKMVRATVFDIMTQLGL